MITLLCASLNTYMVPASLNHYDNSYHTVIQDPNLMQHPNLMQ